MLGRTPNKVSLVFYDISSSATKNLSRILFGKKIEGIWHTSILAFGYEWWYGGDCFQSRPFSTPFGTSPTRIEDIGTTTRTIQELKEFVRNKMRKKYNYISYDVINNNCNHFTNDISHFLVHRGIRKSIVSLPSELLSGGLAKIMRPFLNKWLGNFQSDSVGDESDVVSKLRAEKTAAAVSANQNFKAGDIAVWKRTESDWIFCEILTMNKDGTVKIKVFRNMKFEIKLLKNKSYLTKITKSELDENEVSINYLIALSILESNRKKSSSDLIVMKEINSGLVDGLIADQSRRRTSTDASVFIGGVLAENSHHISVMAPMDGTVGLSEDEEEEETKCCAKWSRILCPCKTT
jgi:hypothetical protein